MRRTAVVLLVGVACGLSASPGSSQPAPPKPDYSRGAKQLDVYFKDQVKQISDACLSDLTTKEVWEKRRPALRRQFFEMMGLWPLPEKTDLKATVTGTLDGGAFTVEKLHFQSMPGLYVTANLYVPKNRGLTPPARQERYPTILYLCGHGRVAEGAVSFGNKVHYHYHPSWFASNGYVCLAIDTLQLGEIEAVHHGTYRENRWWWHARGYTPAGVELWNSIRAIDYLETRPEVDTKRLGVTGRSGGGAYSWWIAAADDRPQAIVPVAGIADLYAHVCEGAAERLKTGVIAGHCDCMYFVNTHRWDFATVAALCAPRPLLLGNSDKDDIFPVEGYRRLAEKVNKVYALYDAAEKFQLLETKGPHGDSPELLAGINGWMNRWLKGDSTADVKATLEKRFKPAELKVFATLPEKRVNETIDDTLIPKAKFVEKDWPAQAEKLREALKSHVFGGWAKNPPPLKATVAADETHDGVRLRAIDFVSETGVELRMWVMTSPKMESPAEVILSVLDEPGWERWCADLGPAFADALQLTTKPKRDDAKFAQNRAAMESNKWAFAVVAPRGIGPTRWAEPGSRDDAMVRRRFVLIGQTLDGQRVWDVRRAVAALGTLPDLAKPPLTLQGHGDAAGIALYSGLFEPGVKAFDLWHLPPTHKQGPIFLNVLKYLDAPQAVALAFPRPVTLHVKAAAGRADWDGPFRLDQAAGGKSLTLKVVGE